MSKHKTKAAVLSGPTLAQAIISEPYYDDFILAGGAGGTAVPPIRRIYIAGPMRGYDDFNFPAFYEAEEYLAERGWVVGNPARMDDATGGTDQFTVLPGNEGVRLAMERDLVWIAKNADAMYMLRGWEKSSGANAEWTLAKTLGIDIYYQETI